MKNFPKITVVTVVKNAAGTMEKAIQSILQQDYPNLEYIVLDGASTDGTIDVIKKYDQQISFWKSEKDKGASDCYNQAIDLASGEIIGYLNADDFYESGLLKKVGEIFEKDDDLDVVSFRYRIVEFKNGQYAIKSESDISDVELDRNKDCSCLGINAKFFHKRVFAKHGLPLKEIKKGQAFLSNDIELLIRLILNDVKNIVVDEIGCNYLASASSNSFSDGYKNNPIYMEDKVLIAKRFLGDEFRNILTPLWERKFRKWIKKYRAKLVALYIRTKNFAEAKRHFVEGIKENSVTTFFFYVLKTLIRK